MRADQDLDVDSEIVGMPQNFDHAPHRPLVRAAEIHNLGRDDHAVQILDGFHLHRTGAHAVHGFARGGQGHVV